MDPATCLVCGETFTPKRTYVDGRGGRFCSRPCLRKYTRKRPPVVQECSHCGKSYTPQRAMRSNVVRAYCSIECHRAARKADGRESLANRKHLLKKKYGITLERYWAMHAAQNGGCAICGRTEPVGRCAQTDPMWLAVDHDHESGSVRGLLCMPCNIGLGVFDHDPERMTSAISYLAAADVTP